MCEDCSEMPRHSLRRHEDLCQECWTELEQLHGTFPLWKVGLNEVEVIRHQAKLFQGTARLHHQINCRNCGREFQSCQSLVEAAKMRNGS